MEGCDCIHAGLKDGQDYPAHSYHSLPTCHLYLPYPPAMLVSTDLVLPTQHTLLPKLAAGMPAHTGTCPWTMPACLPFPRPHATIACQDYTPFCLHLPAMPPTCLPACIAALAQEDGQERTPANGGPCMPATTTTTTTTTCNAHCLPPCPCLLPFYLPTPPGTGYYHATCLWTGRMGHAKLPMPYHVTTLALPACLCIPWPSILQFTCCFPSYHASMVHTQKDAKRNTTNLLSAMPAEKGQGQEEGTVYGLDWLWDWTMIWTGPCCSHCQTSPL